jgi:predicted GNAT superfamily acetyltransferase
MHLRPIEPADHPWVLEVNERHVDLLSPLDDDRLSYLLARTDRGDLIEVDGVRAGFVLTFAPEAGYDGANYAWFTERFGGDFYYLDRVVFAERFRRRGLGGFAYDELERVAAKYGRMTLEVNLVPRNDASLAFHARRGYDEVGRLGDQRYQVSMLEKTFR